MKKFTQLTGHAAPLPVANIDTDQIIPKQFLSTVERTGLSRGLFFDMRFQADGSPNPDFVLNQPAYQGARILIAGPNFGCGSSREHAPWALLDYGIECVISASFADIFFNNCFKNGVLPLVLDPAVVDDLMAQANGQNAKFDIDLARQTLTSPAGHVYHFEIDPGRKKALLEGLDEIGQSLVQQHQISDYEHKRKLMTPWLG
ncbi:3-isopropylmalate dehydratase small subunit 1 [Candidatus Phycosocius bacilliformis]|uniref:3-isopropylmalate dehydratase small subunit n=1 Tax=Candidatus Phycosocius bacilliformis TaxID=1445552 RepID=A0A2P2E6W6_9PROT|nr:3-isopropylmalate dehydratase small subunit [Candidatus Phycosocius bacilliformis]GBF56806.1 3-isopropylmalate dehydratase small subunit 1 [Candidatus Phycosocius bacilliformis]